MRSLCFFNSVLCLEELSDFQLGWNAYKSSGRRKNVNFQRSIRHTWPWPRGSNVHVVTHKLLSRDVGNAISVIFRWAAIISRNLSSSSKNVGGCEGIHVGMRFRWKRGRPSCRKLLCFTCIAVFIVIVYRFINEESSRFEKQWSCEELRAKELLIELVSIFFYY